MTRNNDLPIRREQIDKPYFMRELETAYRESLMQMMVSMGDFTQNPSAQYWNTLTNHMAEYQEAAHNFSMLISEERPL